MATAQGLQRPHNSLYKSTGPEKAIQHTSLPARRQKVLLLCEWSQWFTGFLLGLDSTSCCPYLRAGQPQLFQIHSGLDSPSYSRSYSNSLAYLKTGWNSLASSQGWTAPGIQIPWLPSGLEHKCCCNFCLCTGCLSFRGGQPQVVFHQIVCRILKTSKNSHELT